MGKAGRPPGAKAKPKEPFLPRRTVSSSRDMVLRASPIRPQHFVAGGATPFDYCEGSWADFVRLARAILSNDNTALVAPDFYLPEFHLVQEKP